MKYLLILLSSFFVFNSSEINYSEYNQAIEKVLESQHKNNTTTYGYSFYKSNAVQIISTNDTETAFGIAGNTVHMNVITINNERALDTIYNDKLDYVYRDENIRIEIIHNRSNSFIKAYSQNAVITAEVKKNDELFIVLEIARLISSIKINPITFDDVGKLQETQNINVNNSHNDFFTNFSVRSDTTIEWSLSTLDSLNPFLVHHQKAPRANIIEQE